MTVINLKDPQPLDCPKCKSKEGYQYSNLHRMSYTSFHSPTGEYEGGEYSDGVCLNYGSTCYCCNCGTKLPFKINKETLNQY